MSPGAWQGLCSWPVVYCFGFWLGLLFWTPAVPDSGEEGVCCFVVLAV